MAWKKLGLLFVPDGQHAKGKTHASLPVPIKLSDNIYRVLYASRDENNHSHIWSIDVDLSLEKPRVIDQSIDPILEPGPLGHFDDSGVYPTSVVKIENKLYLYYIGWVTGAVAPMFYTNIGLAVSTDNGKTFEKFSAAPIFGRDSIDPWMVTSSFVLNENNLWKMWYVGGSHWDNSVVPWQSFYQIKYAESKDGIQWIKSGDICIPLTKEEHHISRACVIPSNIGYEAWYGVNSGQGYRIGHATSINGKTWCRQDSESGIELSVTGWDSQTQSYPYVIDTSFGRFMFYNGNGFGRSGLGLATWL